MAVDRTSESTEAVEEEPAPDRRPPPDRPGAEGQPSRADSRSGAANANESTDVGRQGTERPPSAAGQRAPERVTGDVEPSADQSEVTDLAESAEAPDTRSGTANATKSSDGTGTEHASAEQEAETADTGFTDTNAVSDDQPRSPEVADEGAEQPPDTEAEAADGSAPRSARRDVIDQKPPDDDQDDDVTPPKAAPAQTKEDRAVRPEASAERLTPAQHTGTRESQESVPTNNAEQVTSARAEQAGASDDSSDKPVLHDDGAWEWKGLRLTPEDNALADQAIAARQMVEGRDVNGEYHRGGLTPAMRGVEHDLMHGELVGDTEKYALKGEDRFKEKLAKRISLEPDKPTDQLAAEIHDGIRYTFTFPSSKYTSGVYEADEKLRQRGYELCQRKPSWGDSQYKGVNSRWTDPGSGVLFEVQFHTPESWDAKQRTHDAYATIENPKASETEKTAARKYQQEISAAIPVPDGATEIPAYREEER